MSGLELDWAAIRPLNGGKDRAFEELCAQLARTVCPSDARFIRKGTPDAGVECFCVLADGSEWAWQAKYIDALGDSQWAQIDDSVRTAVEKHPQLARYTICVPLDRADGRLEGRKSALEKWSERVTRWKKLLAKGRDVDFVFWGSHELLAMLSKAEHAGRVRLWFGAPAFDRAWYQGCLATALASAGPRYTPEIHVDLPIARAFEAFGRTLASVDQAKAHARTIRRSWQRLDHAVGAAEPLGESWVSLRSCVDRALEALAAASPTPVGASPLGLTCPP